MRSGYTLYLIVSPHLLVEQVFPPVREKLYSISVAVVRGTSPLPLPTARYDGTLWVVERGSGLDRPDPEKL
ncbi:MAG: hypothetical protein AAF543_10130 [Pseudomonadota bacterium]